MAYLRRRSVAGLLCALWLSSRLVRRVKVISKMCPFVKSERLHSYVMAFKWTSSLSLQLCGWANGHFLSQCGVVINNHPQQTIGR